MWAYTIFSFQGQQTASLVYSSLILTLLFSPKHSSFGDYLHPYNFPPFSLIFHNFPLTNERNIVPALLVFFSMTLYCSPDGIREFFNISVLPLPSGHTPIMSPQFWGYSDVMDCIQFMHCLHLFIISTAGNGIL